MRLTASACAFTALIDTQGFVFVLLMAQQIQISLKKKNMNDIHA